MNTMSLEQNNVEAARWLRFLSRWALATALMIIALFIVYLGGVGITASDTALGVGYADLFQAVRSPVLYRVAMTLDALGWLMMGGTLLTLAVILRSRAPIRSLLIAACGIGMLAGSLGGFIRLVGIADLAAQYAVAAPAQQSVLLQSMLTLREIINAHFVAGDVLASAGYLFVVSAAFAMGAFPRWLTGWAVLAGVLAGLQAATSALSAFSFPLLFLTVVVGIMGLHFAMAVVFWRPSPALVSATANA
jgi:hypothetical protein